MLGLQDPFSRLHNHHASQQQQYVQPQTPQNDLQGRLEEAKRRAIASVRRPHQPPGPTPLSRVYNADDESTDEAPTSLQFSPCPPSRMKPGEGMSLFERTSFKKQPPTGPKAGRDVEDRGRGFSNTGSATRDTSAVKPFAFLKDDPQANKVETAWNPGKWAAAREATTAINLYSDAGVLAAKAWESVSPVPSPWLGSNEQDYVPPPAVTPPAAMTWGQEKQQEQSTNTPFGNGNRPAPLNLGSNIKTPLKLASLPAFQPLPSAVWKTPTTASFVKPPRAPLPISTPTWSAMQAPAPTSHPFSNPSSACVYQPSPPYQPAYTYAHASMSRPQNIHIAPTNAISLNSPLPTPPLTAAGSRPQLSTSIYLACLGRQNGKDVKVMLKCSMGMCRDRDGVSFGRESLTNGVVERYRRGFGCGGCGEMLDVVVC